MFWKKQIENFVIQKLKGDFKLDTERLKPVIWNKMI